MNVCVSICFFINLLFLVNSDPSCYDGLVDNSRQNLDRNRSATAFDSVGNEVECLATSGILKSCTKKLGKIRIVLYRNGSYYKEYTYNKGYPGVSYDIVDGNGVTHQTSYQGFDFFNNVLKKDYENLDNTSLDTVMLFHGFRADVNKKGWNWVDTMSELASSHKEYHTVLFVDWSRDAFRTSKIGYVDSLYEATKSGSTCFWVTKLAAELNSYIKERKGSLGSECWGHSLGSIMCASIAKNLKEESKDGFRRIVGMDTAGQFTDSQETDLEKATYPGLQTLLGIPDYSFIHNITQEDGKLVMIHSNKNVIKVAGIPAGKLGTNLPHGHVDIYLNWNSGSDKYCDKVKKECSKKEPCMHELSIVFWTNLLRDQIFKATGESKSIGFNFRNKNYLNYHAINSFQIFNIKHNVGSRTFPTQGKRVIMYTDTEYGTSIKSWENQQLLFNIIRQQKTDDTEAGSISCYPKLCFATNPETNPEKLFKYVKRGEQQVRFNQQKQNFTDGMEPQFSVIYKRGQSDAPDNRNQYWRYFGDKEQEPTTQETKHELTADETYLILLCIGLFIVVVFLIVIIAKCIYVKKYKKVPTEDRNVEMNVIST